MPKLSKQRIAIREELAEMSTWEQATKAAQWFSRLLDQGEQTQVAEELITLGAPLGLLVLAELSVLTTAEQRAHLAEQFFCRDAPKRQLRCLAEIAELALEREAAAD